MTVRVTTLKGVEAGRYYTDRLPSYYLDGEEPPGRWWGRAAGRLGLQGQVDPEAFLAVMAGQDPANGSDLGHCYGEGSVRGYDATFSAPKSVSVLFAVGDEEMRRQVVEGPSAGSRGGIGLGGRSCPHPGPSPWPHHVCRRRMTHGGTVPRAHLSSSRPPAAYSCGDRQPGPRT